MGQLVRARVVEVGDCWWRTEVESAPALRGGAQAAAAQRKGGAAPRKHSASARGGSGSGAWKRWASARDGVVAGTHVMDHGSKDILDR